MTETERQNQILRLEAGIKDLAHVVANLNDSWTKPSIASNFNISNYLQACGYPVENLELNECQKNKQSMPLDLV